MSAARRRHVLAADFFLVAFSLVAGVQRDQGIARDEVVYMEAGSGYADFWIELVTGKGGPGRANVTEHFGGPRATDHNREHPPLMKTLFGFSHALLHELSVAEGVLNLSAVVREAVHSLSLRTHPASLELAREKRLVQRLEKPRPLLQMDLNCLIDDGGGDVIHFHPSPRLRRGSLSARSA